MNSWLNKWSIGIFLVFRDTAGQERFRTMTKLQYRGAKVRTGSVLHSRSEGSNDCLFNTLWAALFNASVHLKAFCHHQCRNVCSNVQRYVQMLSLRQKTSFWRNNHVIITPFFHWEWLGLGGITQMCWKCVHLTLSKCWCFVFVSLLIFFACETVNGACYLGAVSIRKTVLPGMAIPMLKIRRPNGRLIFNMEIAIRR